MMKLFRVLTILGASVFAANIDDRIQQYILKHPDVVAQALELYAKNQMNEKLEQVVASQDGDIVLANQKAPNRLVAYIDYRCSACQKSYPWVKDFIQAHPDVALVLRPLPVLGGEATRAALLAYEAEKKGAIAQYNEALLDKSGPVNAERLSELEQSLGLETVSIEGKPYWALSYVKSHYKQSALLDNQSVPLYLLRVDGEVKVLQGIHVSSLDDAYQQLVSHASH